MEKTFAQVHQVTTEAPKPNETILTHQPPTVSPSTNTPSDSDTIAAQQPSAIAKSGPRTSIYEFMAQRDRWADASKGDVAKNVALAGLTMAAAIVSGPFAPLVLLGGVMIAAVRDRFLDKNHRNQHFQGLDQGKLENTVHWIANQVPMDPTDTKTATTLKNLAARYSIAKTYNNVDEQLKILKTLEYLATQGKIAHHIDFGKLRAGIDDKFDAHAAGVVVQKPYEERIKLLCAGQNSPPKSMDATTALKYYNETLGNLADQSHKTLVALSDKELEKAPAAYKALLTSENTVALLAIDRARKARVMLEQQHKILSGENEKALAALEIKQDFELAQSELSALKAQLDLQGEIETELSIIVTIDTRYEAILKKSVEAQKKTAAATIIQAAVKSFQTRQELKKLQEAKTRAEAYVAKSESTYKQASADAKTQLDAANKQAALNLDIAAAVIMRKKRTELLKFNDVVITTDSNDVDFGTNLAILSSANEKDYDRSSSMKSYEKNDFKENVRAELAALKKISNMPAGRTKNMVIKNCKIESLAGKIANAERILGILSSFGPDA